MTVIKHNKLRLNFAIVSLALWVSSLFFSIYTIELVTIHETTVFDNPGYWVYIWELICVFDNWLFSLRGNIQGTLVVLTNPIYFYCLSLFLFNKYRGVQLILMSISVLALCGFYLFKDMWIWGDYVFDRTIVSKDVGYYLWLFSYVVLLLGIGINMRKNR